MFEKDADYRKARKESRDSITKVIKVWSAREVALHNEGFQDGAEFGYNKANEWHYVKDELPELYKDVLVVFPRGDCDVKHLTNHNEWVGRGSWCSLTDIIAWKEIVLPKEIE